ncbi:MAG: hypothetical protein IT548_19420 [Alphaproteobacteria bacterium]|nr:hypothetical protein [Alphaproteobacteria bacterium]
MRPALVLAAGLALMPAFGDVIPPPEDITDVQRAMVGTWQQTELTGRRGHGEGLETLFFTKDRYLLVTMSALLPSNMYTLYQQGGTWTGTRVSDTELSLTLTIDAETPVRTEAMNVQIVDPDTITIPQSAFGPGPALVTFKRVYPATLP